MDIDTELRNYLGEKRELVDAIAREFRAGTPAKTIARKVGEAFGRDQVTQFLAAIALHDAARKALSDAGLDAAVHVSVTGIDPPRQARVHLVADPAVTPEYATLPSRIRAALCEVHIALAPIEGSDVETADDRVDQLLVDDHPLRLIRLKLTT